LEVELCLAQEAMAQLTEARDRADEKAKKAIEELQRKPSLAPHRLPFLFIGDEKLRVVIAATLCAEYRH
jgi:alpha-D-ribose 1-methylphosphonate 5-triphosphate synthase subunit PhnL